jgi:4'-phosphopantetheinyl transferase
MIYWFLQSTSDHPNLAHGIAPEGLLSGSEQARLAGFKVDKRRRDWLLGRWTAKRLVQFYVERQTGLRLPLAALTIDSDPDGAPHLVVASPYHLLPAIGNLQLSISHSGDRALCALIAGAQIGADIERIEPRGWQFVEDYFTAEEILQVRRAPAEQYETVITAIWSAKEAALKALRLGLSVDTRSTACSIAEHDPARDWADVAFAFDHRLLPLDTAPALRGWWRTIDGYVLTIVSAATVMERPPHLVSLSSCDIAREVKADGDGRLHPEAARA